jgi:hypothetical protein
LRAQIQSDAQKLDLEEMSLLDIDVVRVFGMCQSEATKFLHCSPYGPHGDSRKFA